jgi:protocatechuate 3,4-dioxygenase beta subunit
MNQPNENRRDFLKRASIAAIAFPILLNCKSSTLAQKADGVLELIKKNANTSPAVNWCGAIDSPDDVSWKSVLPKKTDKDEPMIISGTVYESDGKTPAPNILIYFYHTDAEGYYGRGNGEVRHGHFRGWMLTDAKGRYEFASIKPAAYPNRTFAAHVHMTLTAKNFKEDSVDSILFEGDKFISAEERNQAGKKGGFNPIVKLEKGAGGVLRATRDIQLWKV